MWIRREFRRVGEFILTQRCGQIASDIRTSLHLLVRLERDLPTYGQDQTLDKRLIRVMTYYLEPREDHEIVDEDDQTCMQWFTDDAASNDMRELFLRAKHRLSSIGSERQRLERIYLSLYKRELSQLTTAEVKRTRAELVKIRRRVIKVWLRQRSRRLTIDPKFLAASVPVLSFILICAGYFHASIVYNSFGIDPTQYFSLSDYLSTSLQQVEHAIWLPISLIATFIFSYVVEPAIPKRYVRVSLGRKLRKLSWTFLLSSGVLALFCFFWREWADLPIVTWIMGWCMFGIISCVQEFIPFRYIANEEVGKFLFVSTVLFSGMIVLTSYMRVNVIHNESSPQEFTIVHGGQSITEAEHSIIGSNSAYVFIWDRESSVEIIPLSKVVSIKKRERGVTQ